MEVVVRPRSLPSARTTRVVPHTVEDGGVVLGTVHLISTPDGAKAAWTLPTWSAAPDREYGYAVMEATLRATPAGASTVALWAPSMLAPEAESGGWSLHDRYTWLQAATYEVPTPSPMAQRYPDAADGIALGHLAHTTAASSAVGYETTLADTFDATFALFEGAWGPVLEACSCLVEGGSSLTGAAMTTLYGDTPLIALLSAASSAVAHEALLTVLDALATFRYPQVNLLLRPRATLVPVAEALQFRSVGEVVRAVLQR